VAAAFGLRTRQALLAVVLVNLITNPVLNYLTILGARIADPEQVPAKVYLPMLVVAEILVVATEWRLLLRALGGSSKRMLAVSAVMNAASAAAGLVLWLA
jgi:hypothetical protein